MSMLFRCASVIFCGISHTLAGDYRVTVEYSLPPFDILGSFQVDGTGTFADPGTGQPTLTIGLDDANIVYFGGLIQGSFNNINISYTGTTGQMTGDWDVPNGFNPATIGPVIIPLADGGATGSWDQIAPLTGGASDAVFQDPNGELKVLSWSIEDLDGPDEPPIGQPYVQLNSNLVYELNGWTIFDSQLPSTPTAVYEDPGGLGVWAPQGFSWAGWDSTGCSFEANEGAENYEYFDGYGGSDFFQYSSSLTLNITFWATEPLLWSTTGNYGYELRDLRSETSTTGVLSELNGAVLAPGSYRLTLMDDNHGEYYENVNQYGCAWDCVQCDCTDCCPEEFYQETYYGYLVSGSYALSPAPPACPADVNNDGSVDFGDLIQLISKWGNCLDCPEDVSLDGEVDFTDLLVVLTEWGPCSPI